MENIEKKQRIFQNLFNLVHEPLIVAKSTVKGQKKQNIIYYPTIFSALNHSQDSQNVIKVNPGLYNQRFTIKKRETKIQAGQITENSIVINQQFPTITINLNKADEKVVLQSLKIANACENSQKHDIKNDSHIRLKQNNYRGYQTGQSMNACLYIKKGILQLDECKISQSTYHNKQNIVPCIIVQQQGTLILNRSQVRGGQGTIGIICKNGKVIIKQSIIKDHGAIGILTIGNNSTSIFIKNSTITKCTEGIVTCGPFSGIIQSNIISSCEMAGICINQGNKVTVLDNQIFKCSTGIKVKNAFPTIAKNSLNHNRLWGVECLASNGYICQGIIKFNTIVQNSKGGVLIEGCLNKSQLIQNKLQFNNVYGIKVQRRAYPHIFMNKIIKTLGDGVNIGMNSKAFLQKNQIDGSLRSNVVIEGPNNIENFIYENKIKNARGQGIFTAYGQKFTIKKNQITNNYNGIVSLTGVQTIQTNIITNNERNGILLIQDNNTIITSNQIRKNKKAGLFIRNTSTGKIQNNSFADNQCEIVIEKDQGQFDQIEENNNFEKAYDIRIPKNYRCQLI